MARPGCHPSADSSAQGHPVRHNTTQSQAGPTPAQPLHAPPEGHPDEHINPDRVTVLQELSDHFGYHLHLPWGRLDGQLWYRL